MEFLYIIIPVLIICGFILFSRLIFSCLFYPKNAIMIGGIKLQGILPSKIPILIDQLKSDILLSIPSVEEFEKKLTDPSNTEKVLALADIHIDNFLRNKLKEKIPVVSMFIGDKTITQLKSVFMEELEELFPSVIKTYLSGLKNNIDPVNFIAKYLDENLQNKIYSIIKKEINNSISILIISSAIFGLFIGILADLVYYFYH